MNIVYTQNRNSINLITPISPFLQMENAVARDRRITLKAKGLYALLLSHGTSYDFSLVREATYHCYEGKKALFSACNELEHWGLISRIRLPGGKKEWTVYGYEDSRLALEVDENGPETRVV